MGRPDSDLEVRVSKAAAWRLGCYAFNAFKEGIPEPMVAEKKARAKAESAEGAAHLRVRRKVVAWDGPDAIGPSRKGKWLEAPFRRAPGHSAANRAVLDRPRAPAF